MRLKKQRAESKNESK